MWRDLSGQVGWKRVKAVLRRDLRNAWTNRHRELYRRMTVPFDNLPRLHRLLRERRALENALVDTGYAGVLRQARSKTA